MFGREIRKSSDIRDDALLQYFRRRRTLLRFDVSQDFPEDIGARKIVRDDRTGLFRVRTGARISNVELFGRFDASPVLPLEKLLEISLVYRSVRHLVRDRVLRPRHPLQRCSGLRKKIFRARGERNESGFVDPPSSRRLLDDELAVSADEDVRESLLFEFFEREDEGVVLRLVVRRPSEGYGALPEDFTVFAENDASGSGRSRVVPRGSVEVGDERVVLYAHIGFSFWIVFCVFV